MTIAQTRPPISPWLTLRPWLPWTDRAGRAVPVKVLVFIAVSAPAIWMLIQWQGGMLSPKPLTDLLRQSGDWAIRLLVATLLVTPLRFVTKWNRWVMVRRMVGLAALFYTLAHLLFYFWDEAFAWGTILREMVLRTYLSVGTAATVLMIALGVTSNDSSIRSLGAKAWNRLHWWIYPLTALSLLHYFMLTRLDASQPALWSGFLVYFWAFRALRHSRFGTGFVPLLLLAVGAWIATMLLEAGYYAISTGADARLILPANFDFSYDIRPAWWVLAGGLVLAFVRAGRGLVDRAKAPKGHAQSPHGEERRAAPRLEPRGNK